MLTASALTMACQAVMPSAGWAQTDRTVLPVPAQAFAGKIAESPSESVPSSQRPVQAPAGAPNLFVFMSDDVGFGMSSTFGGPVPTPNLDRLAAMGQRYNRFHTTAICSATRAALLTGRNHHAVGTGYVSDTPLGYPGYNAHFPPSAATIAQTLRFNGYNTAMFGKHHNVPAGEDTDAGPFDMWPTGLGFEHFFGYIVADTDQWRPRLYRGIEREPEDAGSPIPLDRRLAADAIRWLHNQNAAAPDKPFFIYYAPGSVHAPQQAPADYIARFRGKFDQGWDKVREETFARQLAMGVVPQGTKLTARSDGIPAWDTLSAQQKLFAARQMEVAAAQLAYQDAQFGRILDEMKRMGVLDSTLIMFLEGDNGAEAGAGPRGTVSEIGMTNALEESDAWHTANLDKLGGPDTYPLYPAGWAWAMNAPLRWAKQYTSFLGGIRNGMVMAWPGHVAHPGALCGEFGHVVDVAPTLFEAAGIPAPDLVNGVRQQPLDGKSLLPSLSNCDPNRSRTQYFEMVGKIGVYHDGWFASLDDGRKPWEAIPPKGAAPQKWELYDLRTDFSQADNVAAQNPERMRDMIALWNELAQKNNVFPIDHRFAGARAGLVPSARKTFEFWGKDVSVTANRGPVFTGRSFTIDADLVLDKADASGVVIALGSHFAGWSLYLDKGYPVFTYARSTDPNDITTIRSTRQLSRGPANLRLTFTSEGFLKGGMAEISTADAVLGQGHIGKIFLTPAGLGETLDIGRDTGEPVTTYRTPLGAIEGDVPHVRIKFEK
jgi:arylsulfatase